MSKALWIDSEGRKLILDYAPKPMKPFQIPIPLERFNRIFFPFPVRILNYRSDSLSRNLLIAGTENAIFVRREVLRFRF